MTKWSIYEKNGMGPEIIKDGFNWCAFLFVGLWALFRGLVMAGIIGITVTVVASRMPADADIIAIPIILGMMLLYGFKGNSWACAKLEKDRYRLVQTVEAASKDGAKAKYSSSNSTSNVGESHET